MEAVSYLAPALAPLAIKLIDKYIFDGQPAAPVPQIIQIPAPPLCACCCGQQLSDGYDSISQTCSTCMGKSSSSYRPSSTHRLSVKSSMRSSSTSDAYDKKCKSARNTRILSDSTDRRSEKKTDKQSTGENTLAILAGHLKKEISHYSNDKSSSRDSKPLRMEKSCSKLKIGKTGSTSSSGSRKSAKSIHESKRHRSVSKI